MPRISQNLLPVTVDVNAESVMGPFEWQRHSFGQGGVSACPPCGKVLDGIRMLRPTLIRLFIQEYFNIYRGGGIFDWSLLDRYLQAFADTGAKLVCSICIKLRSLYPVMDASVWMPSDLNEWENVLGALVRRYTADKQIVTHWEIANEPDIGEAGGTPFHFATPEEYGEFYSICVKAILSACPSAKVGGPVVALSMKDFLPGFIRYCAKTGVHLDFVSWHGYDDEPKDHAAVVKRVDALLDGFPGKRPEMMCTEWNRTLAQPYALPELLDDPTRAAIVGAAVVAFMDTPISNTFLYHIAEQALDPEAFRVIMPEEMIRRQFLPFCNETPMDLGMFGEYGEPRPRYFVYSMLAMMGDERLEVLCADPDVYALGAKAPGRVSAFLVNYSRQTPQDKVATVRFLGIQPGRKRLTVYRIDEYLRWDDETLLLKPVESRPVYTLDRFNCQVYCPAGSVSMVVLEDV